uniref:Uncharacterized protein n=1 Tax=Oryza brachyantha TaxID=4533 RepID=J3N9W7_ORYBR
MPLSLTLASPTANSLPFDSLGKRKAPPRLTQASGYSSSSRRRRQSATSHTYLGSDNK